MNLNNPRINRIIGYLIMFVAFVPFTLGYKMVSSGIMIIVGIVILTIGILLLCASVVWVFKKVRCPHCNALLHLKLYPISKCPYCGKRTDDI